MNCRPMYHGPQTGQELTDTHVKYKFYNGRCECVRAEMNKLTSPERQRRALSTRGGQKKPSAKPRSVL